MDQKVTTSPVTLDDRYSLASGKAYMSGTQALLRLLLEQAWRDKAAGLNTAGFVSGYRGSPLGGFDLQLWKAQKYLQEDGIHFEPGLNEELAVTAVWGSQQTDIFGSEKYDGVFGLWYGKTPGLDRSGDAFKHANMNGTSRYGGVLAVSGDDPGASSTTVPSQSEHTFASFMMPVIYPSSIEEFLHMGLLGYGMSRYSGNWIGFKTLSDIAETSASINIGTAVPEFKLPDNHGDIWEQVSIRWPDDRWDADSRLQEIRLPAAVAFARANQFDQVVIAPPQRRFGIVAAGKAYLDMRQALDDLGVTTEIAAEIGLTVNKLGLIWPIEHEGMTEFAQGLEEILVVEERRAFIETQIKELAFNWDASTRPQVIGKSDENGQPLIPSTGETSSVLLAEIIGRRLLAKTDHPVIKQGLAQVESRKQQAVAVPSKEFRVPHYCPGCPHNRGTSTPEGSLAMAGIGCHSLAMWMPNNDTVTFTHMGAEGVNWIGASAFVDQKHIFQNLGDGTYVHSGSLAIRAAQAAGCTMTYKILYNDAVAMTGGQSVEGSLSVLDIARQIAAEGIGKIVVVADDIKKYDEYGPDYKFPRGVELFPRKEMTAVMKACRDYQGVSVLIYDQVCATERRRRRKKGLMPPSTKRVVINERVCEACGDCSIQSNCVAIRTLETPLGTKRQIDQSSCNMDLLCLEGFCPALVTVEGGTLKMPSPSEELNILLDEPSAKTLTKPYDILIAGVGGSGLITIGNLLGMAAHLEGKECSVLDNTGIARMGGSVSTHVRLGESDAQLNASRIADVDADVLIGGDPVVSASAEVLTRIRADRTQAVVNTFIAPAAAQAADPELAFDSENILANVKSRVDTGQSVFTNVTDLAYGLLGNKVYANIFMLGIAFQKGLIPLEFNSIRQAIELNDKAVEENISAFNWGRRYALDPDAVTELAGLAEMTPLSLEQKIAVRKDHLTAYQNAAYAKRFTDLITKARAREQEIDGASDSLISAIADNYFKLLAHKDEYEVARLYSDGEFEQKISDMFGGNVNLHYHIGRKLIVTEERNTDRLKKRTFGPWFMTAFQMLNSLKGLRGTPFDPFGFSTDRQRDRQLVQDYEQTIEKLLADLSPGNLAIAIEIASLPADIRGFGAIKDRSIAVAKKLESELLVK